MALVDVLCHRGPKKYVESWMPMDEVLQRVTARFPLAVVDRERGDQMVRDHLADLISLDAHTVVLENWKAMEGHVAYVTIRKNVDGPQFHFFLTERPTSFDIEYDREEDRDIGRPLLESLVEALGEYDLVTDDPDEPSDLAPDDLPDSVRDNVGGMHLRWEEDVAILAAGPHPDGEPFPQESDDRHWCDDGTNVILDLSGFACVPPSDLIEWVQTILQTAQGRGTDIRLCYPPGTVNEQLTRYYRMVQLPIHDSLAEALAAAGESEP